MYIGVHVKYQLFHKKGKNKQSLYRAEQTLGVPEVRGFQISIQVVRLSALLTGRSYLNSKYSWYSFLLQAERNSEPWRGRKDYVNEKLQ
jgi:hypothetical protein